jgi:lysophospholipase L1-like esterase
VEQHPEPADRARWTSFVALGDSFTEGLDDPSPDGSYRGWADRVAVALAGPAGAAGFRYANLALRGLGLDAVAGPQVDRAVAMAPDLVSIAAGGNDVLRPRFDVGTLGRTMDEAIRQLTQAIDTVVVFAGFQPAPGLPFGRTIATRAAAYNDLTRASATRHGAVLVDLWAMPELRHRRLWSPDRLHLSTAGHQLVATRVLEALGEPAVADSSNDAVDVLSPSRLAARRADLRWTREYLLPWLGRRLTGRSSGDKLTAKRPDLAPLFPSALQPFPLHPSPLDRGTDLLEETRHS